ncbi:hypothetical protein [Enhygromyxa salina]|uniref:Uncharacterized protein n=1 Tax=Enhygromyxa salina TaxID=215803 RepID=A0A2S9YAQ0_9BACT|nr:hypothetical protein [Enhygromyxa salina]PRQ02086.1 hypothetical protein ENSA7_55930 [Enhygromyxa salina]
MSSRVLHPSNPSRSSSGSHIDGEATPVELEVELKPASRHPWAWLLARVFAVDVMTCSRCGGRMRLVEIADSRDGIARVLANVGLGPRPPPRRRPAVAGQLELDLAARPAATSTHARVVIGGSCAEPCEASC